jgi:hypothetical protein
MMDKLIIGIIIVVAIFTGYGLGSYTHMQKKSKVNLKCIQGELYEEVRTNMFVKSHLQCFEQRSF